MVGLGVLSRIVEILLVEERIVLLVLTIIEGELIVVSKILVEVSIVPLKRIRLEGTALEESRVEDLKARGRIRE